MKDFKPFLILFSVSFFLAVGNYFGLQLFDCATTTFFYSIPELYGYFTLASLAVLLILIRVKKKQPEQIGYVFLLLSSLKMIGAYALLYPILQKVESTAALEKLNFFIVFILFLATDVFLTSILLKDVGKKD